MRIEYLTAESERGRLAIKEVMQHSYTEDIDNVPLRWAIARVVDDVPVSFIMVKPDEQMEFPRGTIRYAFVDDVATRDDRRLEGHFRGILEYTFSVLHSDGVSLVLLHGEQQLYRRFGFDVYTHHHGIFITPELIERKLGTQIPEKSRELLKISNGKYIQKDLLLVDDVKAETFPECKAALQAAAAIAREYSKSRILFWDRPCISSYGFPYLPETNLAIMARACGANICIRGADPEKADDHADWIKVLDTPLLVKEALECLDKPGNPLPKGMICFDTDAGIVTVTSSGGNAVASDGIRKGAEMVKWSSSAIAKMVTGYHTAPVLSAIYDTTLSNGAMSLLEALFPQQWHFSANENWYM